MKQNLLRMFISVLIAVTITACTSDPSATSNVPTLANQMSSLMAIVPGRDESSCCSVDAQ